MDKKKTNPKNPKKGESKKCAFTTHMKMKKKTG
jgi:hypothetical protein